MAEKLEKASMGTETLEIKTPLYDAHVRLGARMVNFHGFLMPLQYSGIIDEHNCVRACAGIFDLSHMGEVEVKGAGALPYLQNLVTNDVAQLADGEALYTPICNEQGGIVDDVILYRISNENFLLVINCENIAKDLDWMMNHVIHEVEIVDKSDETALIAVQGPLSESILGKITDNDISQLKIFRISEFRIDDTSVLISRSGYTGEDGFEIFLHPNHAEKIWDLLLNAPLPVGAYRNTPLPVGLGARDTLRLEAGLRLYGNDIDESTSPLEARMRWAVKFEKGNFIGKEALTSQKTNGVKQKLIGFEMIDRGIPRAGFTIVNNEHSVIGKVTSGTYSPSLKKSIGLGYVETNYSTIGTTIGIKIRDSVNKAVVVKTPFAKR